MIEYILLFLYIFVSGVHQNGVGTWAATLLAMVNHNSPNRGIHREFNLAHKLSMFSIVFSKLAFHQYLSNTSGRTSWTAPRDDGINHYEDTNPGL